MRGIRGTFTTSRVHQLGARPEAPVGGSSRQGKHTSSINAAEPAVGDALEGGGHSPANGANAPIAVAAHRITSWCGG